MSLQTRLSPEAAGLKVLFGPMLHPLAMGDYINNPNTLGYCMQESGVRARLPYPSLYEDFRFPPQVITVDFDRSMSFSFQEILDALPTGWEPDVVIWHGFVYMLPQDLHLCPYPLFLVACDWHHQYSVMREYFDAFEHIFCDRSLLYTLRQQGYENASYWPDYSFDPRIYHTDYNERRDWDVTFIGNLKPAVYSERNRYLLQVAQLGQELRVRIATRVYHQAYARVLNQSKMVFNHAVRGEMNLRAYEAAACGALLLMEEDNLEVADFLPPGEACVLYNDENLQDLVRYYAQHDLERERIARNAQERIQNFTYTHQFTDLLNQLPACLARLARAPGRAQRLKQRQQHSQVATMPEMQRMLLLSQMGTVSDMYELRDQTLARLVQSWQRGERTGPESLKLLNALAVSLNDAEQSQREGGQHQYKSTDISAQEAYLCLAREQEQRREQQTQHPVLLHNLAWMAYFRGDWQALALHLRDQESCLRYQLPVGCLEDFGQYLLPYGFTRFHGLWLRTLRAHEGDAEQRHQALLKLLSWSGFYLLGMWAIQQKNWLLAGQSLTTACQYSHQFPEAFFALADVLCELGENTLALSALEDGLEQGVFFFNAWQQKCELLIDTQQYQAAAETLATMDTLFQHDIFAPLHPVLRRLRYLIQQALGTAEQQGFFD